MSRFRRSSAVTAAALAVVLSGMCGAAWADPTPPPSSDDVRKAQENVQTAQRSVTEIEADLASLQDQTAAAQVKVQEAGEAYTQAQAALETAQTDAATARTQADTAAADAKDSRSRLAAIYRASVQDAGQSDLLDTLVGASDVQDLMERDAAQRIVSQQTQVAVDRNTTAQALADSARAKADAAADVERERKQKADEALAEANQAAADLTSRTQAAADRREVLLAQLATAKQTSVDVEREYQAGVERARQAAREEAARQQRIAEEQARARSQTPATPAAPADPGGRVDPAPPPADSGSAAKGRAAVDWAKSKLGAPYVWAATGPWAFDCSGLTYMAWQSVGVNITRTSRSQYQAVSKISYGELRPGDLVFYASNTRDPSSIYHVVMYIGDGKIIEAPYPGGHVQITSMRWSAAMPYAGRP